ncbi:MAG: ABC transporter permease [Candidatus Gracilibacteria bacterium]|nr:ABC transporter permease [Candidatus Gracilibacteria bacterium]MDD2908914.1 ABC transporter permease [Candidatus Gracilibacteria bacterium]
MALTEYFTSAIAALWSNKLRSALSMLGIIIGVFSIITMLAIGEGTSSSITDRFNSMGANLITVSPGGSNTSKVGGVQGGGSSSDLLDDGFINFVASIPGVKKVSPTVTTSKQFIYGTYNTNSSIVGVESLYKDIKGIELSNGRFITDEDIKANKKVAVVGYTITTDAFGSGTIDPIGKEIKLEDGIYTVVGTLQDNSQANRRIFLPISTVMNKIIGTHYYSSIDIEVDDSTKTDFYQTYITSELLKYTKTKDSADAPFSVSSMSEMLSSITAVTGTMTMFLAGIAMISLLVGGIGVMNIMLVSVTERTREIGIRKAIGATKTDILMQFLIEALLISVVAGGIGVALSFVIVNAIKSLLTSVITTNSIFMAFGSVVMIGIVFGILPARKAARLKPIDALRFE